MGRKFNTIYEYFSDYSEEEINSVICNLSLDEILILKYRYGDDLHNPQTSEEWDKEKSNIFYKSIIPKMRRLLAKNLNNAIDEKNEKKLTTNTLLQMIKMGKNNNEICEELNLSTKQLHEELLKIKNMGVITSRKYYSDGSIKYKNVTSMKDYKESNQTRTIITDSTENKLKVLLISDLHFGNKLERLDLLDRAYNYCKKNGINIIICGGDLIDGSYTHGEQNITNLYEQVQYFIEKYPYDKSILTFSVAGDHDISTLYDKSLDIIELCNNYRHDIVICGYNNAFINLKNDRVHLYHSINGGSICKSWSPIILHGHTHKYQTKFINGSLNVTIPTLSEIIQPMPSALEMNLYFSKGYIANTVIKHLYFGTQDIVLSESTFDLLTNRTIECKPINNIEKFKTSTVSNDESEYVLKLS